MGLYINFYGANFLLFRLPNDNRNIALLCVLPIIALRILATIQCAQVREEVVLEDAG